MIDAKHHMSPKQRYQQDLKNMHLSADPAQSRAVDALQVLYEALSKDTDRKAGFLDRIFSRPRHIPGIYLVGSVGRGYEMVINSNPGGARPT